MTAINYIVDLRNPLFSITVRLLHGGRRYLLRRKLCCIGTSSKLLPYCQHSYRHRPFALFISTSIELTRALRGVVRYGRVGRYPLSRAVLQRDAAAKLSRLRERAQLFTSHGLRSATQSRFVIINEISKEKKDFMTMTFHESMWEEMFSEEQHAGGMWQKPSVNHESARTQTWNRRSCVLATAIFLGSLRRLCNCNTRGTLLLGD